MKASRELYLYRNLGLWIQRFDCIPMDIDLIVEVPLKGVDLFSVHSDVEIRRELPKEPLSNQSRVRVIKGCREWKGYIREIDDSHVTLEVETECGCIVRIQNYDWIQTCCETKCEPAAGCKFTATVHLRNHCSPTARLWYLVKTLDWSVVHHITVDESAEIGPEVRLAQVSSIAMIRNSSDVEMAPNRITLSTRDIQSPMVADPLQSRSMVSSSLQTESTPNFTGVDDRQYIIDRPRPLSQLSEYPLGLPEPIQIEKKYKIAIEAVDQPQPAQILWIWQTPIYMPSGRAYIWSQSTVEGPCLPELGLAEPMVLGPSLLAITSILETREGQWIEVTTGDSSAIQYTSEFTQTPIHSETETESSSERHKVGPTSNRVRIHFDSALLAPVLAQHRIGTSPVRNAFPPAHIRGPYLEWNLEVIEGQSTVELTWVQD